MSHPAPRMVRVRHLDPHAELHKLVREVAWRIMNRKPVPEMPAKGSGPIMAQISLPSVKRRTSFD